MALIRCPLCSYAIPPSAYERSGTAPCPLCQREARAWLLPALVRSDAPAAPPPVGTPPAEGENACFYSPNRRATKSCDHCGVFISDAWAAQWGQQTVCLKCLELLRSKNKDQRFESTRTLWDNIALGLNVVPLIFAIGLGATLIGAGFGIMALCLTIITAPAAIFVVMRYWSAPRSLVPAGRLQLVLALLLGLVLVLAWAAMLVWVATTSFS